jgi:hypothetical protein
MLAEVVVVVVTIVDVHCWCSTGNLPHEQLLKGPGAGGVLSVVVVVGCSNHSAPWKPLLTRPGQLTAVVGGVAVGVVGCVHSRSTLRAVARRHGACAL